MVASLALAALDLDLVCIDGPAELEACGMVLSSWKRARIWVSSHTKT
jgi:hypothetical protein